QDNLAWVLATCPDTTLRNGAEALDLAVRENQMTGNQNPKMLRTLAAALAENGRFPEALTVVQKAMQLAQAQQPMLVESLREQIDAYQAGRPFRDVIQTNTPGAH